MEKKIECGIVYDLLPNYIEHVTNEYSNKFIENHLNTCEECKKLYDNLNNEMNTNSSTKAEINFFKKYKKHLNILKMIIGVILIIGIVLTVNTIRKVKILYNAQNKISEYINSSNYYIKSTTYENNVETIVETYKKDNVILQKITQNSQEGTSSLINYSNDKTTNTYISNGDSKIAILDVKNPIMATDIENWTYTQSKKECIASAFMCSIKSEKLNGINCYKITNFYPAQKFMPDFNDFYFYIDKETGLMIKNSKDGEPNYEYKFNAVTDKDLIEPNINEYIVQENS